MFNLFFVVFLVCTYTVRSFVAPLASKFVNNVNLLRMVDESGGRSRRELRRAERADALSTDAVQATHIPGKDIPIEILEMKKCLYDMILVERISAPASTTSGIVLPPGPEGKDRRQIGIVLSIPDRSYGLESEQGRIQKFDEIANVEVGEYIFVKDPWGVGPKNIEIGERKFSFHKAAHITARC